VRVTRLAAAMAGRRLRRKARRGPPGPPHRPPFPGIDLLAARRRPWPA